MPCDSAAVSAGRGIFLWAVCKDIRNQGGFLGFGCMADEAGEGFMAVFQEIQRMCQGGNVIFKVFPVKTEYIK